VHSKMMIVDDRHAYLGSANWDWRSLTQVKELGAIIMDCPALALDIQKIFKIYQLITGGPNVTLPKSFPRSLETAYNSQHPFTMHTSDGDVEVFIASGPKKINTPKRTNDMDAILSAISTAKTFIHASVMDYSPINLYGTNHVYWPVMDDALRLAALEGVSVQLLASLSSNATVMRLAPYLQSLDVLPNISVKMVIVPPQLIPPIPFTRINHVKYIVTDKLYYITTSNWSPDYFLNTAGASITIRTIDVTWRRMNAIFIYDWTNERYTYWLRSLFPVTPRPNNNNNNN